MAETLNALRGLAQTLRSYAGSPVLSLDLSHALDCAAEELGRRAEPVGEPVMTDIHETLAEAEDQLAMSAPGSSALDSVKRLVSRLAVPPEAQGGWPKKMTKRAFIMYAAPWDLNNLAMGSNDQVGVSPYRERTIRTEEVVLVRRATEPTEE